MELSPKTVTKLEVSDPEMLRAAIQSPNLEVCQITGRPASSRIAKLMLREARFESLSLGAGQLSSGVMAKDCYTFVFVVACPEKGHSFNFESDHNDGFLAFFQPGGLVDAITPEGYAHAAITLPASVFQGAMEREIRGIPDRVLAQGAAMRVGAGAETHLRNLVIHVEDLIWYDEGALSSPLALNHLQSDLISGFFAALSSGHDSIIEPESPRVSKRYQRLRQARDYIAEHAQEPIHLENLCAAVGLSKRSVEYLFRDLLGVSPIAYLRHQRLSFCYNALRKATPGPGTVKAIALEGGFWHLGRFSVEYKALFGEMPSETLTRTNG